MRGLGAGSHVPWLGLLVSRTKGPAVEFGIGDYSTPLLHAMVAMQRRQLFSYETDFDWFQQYREMESDYHHLELIQSWAPDRFNVCGYWDLAFVDCSPGVDDRQDVSPRVDLIKRLKGKSKFIAAHDTEADIPPSAGGFGWKELDGLFRYETVLDRFRPWTTVYSDVEEFRP